MLSSDGLDENGVWPMYMQRALTKATSKTHTVFQKWVDQLPSSVVLRAADIISNLSGTHLSTTFHCHTAGVLDFPIDLRLALCCRIVLDRLSHG